MVDRILLSEKTAEKIKKLIIENKYQPGDKLPNEIELAETLNVGRSTIREAIKILISINIVEIKRGKGTFVCKNPGLIEDPFGVTFLNEKQLLQHLLETRLIFEPEIAALAARRATEEEIERLKENKTTMEDNFKKGKTLLSDDVEFHRLIAKSTKNPVLQRIFPIINECISERYMTDIIPSYDGSTSEYHQRIIDAIEQRDPEKAYAVMKRHIERAIEQIK
ncbi:MAG: FadR family transcriptional regulator [Firmicutes bacterium]|nr:FadR family transcriptional regulator [Bacillota bacterium]